MTRIDPIYLLSESNSKSVLDVFGKIMFKEKDKRTKADFEVLKNQSLVDNSIKMVILQTERDYCTDLKNEFGAYVAKNKKTKKNSMN